MIPTALEDGTYWLVLYLLTLILFIVLLDNYF